MYHAKNSGKDQYAVYDPALAPNGSLPRLCPAEAPAATVAPKNFRKHAVEYIFRIFLENPDVDKAIPVLFDLVGKLFVLSRIELFEVSDDRQQLCATFDWSAAEAPPRNSAQSAAVCAELLRDIGDWDGKELYGTRTEGPGILARLLCPIRESEQPIAAINFEMYSDSGMPAIAERETLSLLSEAVGLFLTRARKRELLKKQQEFFGSLLKQVNAYIYCVNPATYEIVFANEQLASKANVRPGNTCYRSIRGYDAPCPDCPLQELHTVDDRVTKELYHPSLKRWSETTASLIRWDNDQLIGLFSSYDITQYRADAARIAFANENLPGGMLGGYLEKGLPLYFINDCMLRYLGYPDKEAFIAATDGLLVNCIYDEDRPAVLDAIRRGLSENGEYEFTHRIKKQDGGYLWVNEIGKRIVAEDGKPSIICLCMDVSPQMELRNQLNLYRSAARGGAFVVRIDEDFTLLYGNDIFYDVYGYPKPSKAEEPDRVQTKCVNYIHPDDLPYVRQLVHDSVAAGKTTLQWEMRIVTGSDRLRWLLTTGTLEYRGKELVMNGFITEITELHELREKLARDEQRYRIALRQINTNVWEYDLRTRAVSMTESAEEKHGHLGHLENVP
ncbi:MAG: PAS domain-containing protein, partial [Oscillospiraceae bacterium]